MKSRKYLLSICFIIEAISFSGQSNTTLCSDFIGKLDFEEIYGLYSEALLKLKDSEYKFANISFIPSIEVQIKKPNNDSLLADSLLKFIYYKVPNKKKRQVKNFTPILIFDNSKYQGVYESGVFYKNFNPELLFAQLAAALDSLNACAVMQMPMKNYVPMLHVAICDDELYVIDQINKDTPEIMRWAEYFQCHREEFLKLIVYKESN